MLLSVFCVCVCVKSDNSSKSLKAGGYIKEHRDKGIIVFS